MNKNWVLLVSLFSFLLIQPIVSAAGQRNLALHKKLEYNPAPNHELTKDDKDPFKLTDGIQDTTPGYWRGYRWAKKDLTVGWNTSDLIEIKIDLGEVCNVDFINVHTFCGAYHNGIEFPEYIVASSSLDDRRYQFSSFTTTDGWEFNPVESKLRVIRLPVEQRARYIKLYVRPFATSFFSTEIEVFESQDADLDTNSAAYLSKEQMLSLVERARQLQRDSHELEVRMKDSQEKHSALINDWQEVTKLISNLNTKLTDEKAVEAEMRFVRLRATWFRSKYNTPWLCYPAEPMDVLHQGNLPADVPENVEISLYQWQNEYSAATINVVNCSETMVYFSAHFSPLRSDKNTIDSKDIFELRRGLYIWVPQAGMVTDPLVLQNSKPFPVAPGHTVQLWIGVHSKGLKQDIYKAALPLEARGDGLTKERQIVPIQVEVADSKFPEKLPFFTFNCDYVTRLDNRFTKNNPQIAVKDLTEHYINVVLIRHECLFDPPHNGGNFSPQKLRAEIESRGSMGIPEGKNKSFLLLQLDANMHFENLFGKYGTPGTEKKLKSVLKQIVDFMRSSGHDYDSFAIYPFDETIGWEFIYVAKIIRDFDPNIKIYANRWLGMDKVDVGGELKIVDTDTHFEMIKNLVDIWCPHMQGDILQNPYHRGDWITKRLTDFKKYRDTMKANGKQVWSYYANTGRRSFYYPEKILASKNWRGANRKAFRTMPVLAASLELTGMGFWAYIHGGEDLWEIQEGEQGYGHTVVYDGSRNPDKNCIPEFIVPSKRWQQWRLGVQDAVCLLGHKDLLEEFFEKSDNLEQNDEITTEYLTSLRKRADGK